MSINQFPSNNRPFANVRQGAQIDDQSLPTVSLPFKKTNAHD